MNRHQTSLATAHLISAVITLSIAGAVSLAIFLDPSNVSAVRLVAAVCGATCAPGELSSSSFARAARQRSSNADWSRHDDRIVASLRS